MDWAIRQNVFLIVNHNAVHCTVVFIQKNAGCQKRFYNFLKLSSKSSHQFHKTNGTQPLFHYQARDRVSFKHQVQFLYLFNSFCLYNQFSWPSSRKAMGVGTVTYEKKNAQLNPT